MVIKGFKNGYTLFEACVVMIIVSIFIMVMANVIPHKVKTKVESNAHGHFECYYNAAGELVQQSFIEGKKSDAVNLSQQGKSYCTFTPQGYTRFLILNAVGGGAKGTPGRFVSTFFNNATTEEYHIIPGLGGEDKGSDTVINDAADHHIITARGGFDNNNPANADIDDVSSCVITSTIPRKQTDHPDYSSNIQYYDQDYICDKGPLCEVENRMIKVSYCRTNELYKTSYLPYKDADVEASKNKYKQSQYIAQSNFPPIANRWNSDNKILTYCDTSLFTDYGNEPGVGSPWTVNANCISDSEVIPSLYKMQLRLDISQSDRESNMTKYIKMLQFGADDAINSIHPGDGAEDGDGNPGAVLILW